MASISQLLCSAVLPIRSRTENCNQAAIGHCAANPCPSPRCGQLGICLVV
jgi:hypothetical protein